MFDREPAPVRRELSRQHDGRWQLRCLWPLGARAQQPAMPSDRFSRHQVGGRDGKSSHAGKFRRVWKETGYFEGENVTIAYRWAENKIDRLPELAGELIRRQVAVIVTTGRSSCGLRRKGGDHDDPHCLPGREKDPVRLGLVASLRPARRQSRRGSIFSIANCRPSGSSSCVSSCHEPIVLPVLY